MDLMLRFSLLCPEQLLTIWLQQEVYLPPPAVGSRSSPSQFWRGECSLLAAMSHDFAMLLFVIHWIAPVLRSWKLCLSMILNWLLGAVDGSCKLLQPWISHFAVPKRLIISFVRLPLLCVWLVLTLLFLSMSCTSADNAPDPISLILISYSLILAVSSKCVQWSPQEGFWHFALHISRGRKSFSELLFLPTWDPNPGQLLTMTSLCQHSIPSSPLCCPPHL